VAAIDHEQSEIARRLDKAVSHLRQDLAKVEFWAYAVQAFAQPVPGYDSDKPLKLFDLRKPSPTRNKTKVARRSRKTER
jgi:hypothetical protein